MKKIWMSFSCHLPMWWVTLLSRILLYVQMFPMVSPGEPQFSIPIVPFFTQLFLIGVRWTVPNSHHSNQHLHNQPDSLTNDTSSSPPFIFVAPLVKILVKGKWQSPSVSLCTCCYHCFKLPMTPLLCQGLFYGNHVVSNKKLDELRLTILAHRINFNSQ